MDDILFTTAKTGLDKKHPLFNIFLFTLCQNYLSNIILYFLTPRSTYHETKT